MTEIYRDIKGYEGKYQVSNLGNVKSLHYNNTDKEKIMKPSIVGGYKRVYLGGNCNIAVHHLVAEAFIPNPNALPIINHKDEDKLNNCVDNLEWSTYAYNSNYGTSKHRIAENESKAINQYSLDGVFIKRWNSGTQINKQLGFSNGNICSCCRGNQKTAYGFKWRYATN